MSDPPRDSFGRRLRAFVYSLMNTAMRRFSGVQGDVQSTEVRPSTSHDKRSTFGIEVPGAVVTSDLGRRGRGLARILGYAFLWPVGPVGPVAQDLVILDPTRQVELLREGPYRRGIGRAMRSAALEIERSGLDQYLEKRKSGND